MKEKERKDGYSTIRVPQQFAIEIDKLIGRHGFTSRAEIVKEAVRQYLQKYEDPHLSIINHNNNGAKIRDIKLNQIADINITSKGNYCQVCDAGNCEHIRFALMQSDVIKTTKKEEN
ncbi:ribbon-helix-helix domain-containing protein [Candidatus Bathycorpusculum sp.]|uniref:ribbon-helix-helix domain-containing protein n=1 Tax=Candidatus Bathycorpusculum sp. TaxID=2994959 RepID=UPI00282358CD|nr:ribbon-helix-helix domain-containing protein [Candidatus Termitimicrobium sp.]MCL2686840.1 ribbon-helix-helix domain-containing protein [Candidatus Termitimicrobium sp.]